MDIPGYISSGVLESYLLGLLSEEEAREVESYAAQYPAIRIELRKIEDSFNEYVSLYSSAPAAAVKEKVFTTIGAKHTPAPVKNEVKIVEAKKEYTQKSTSTLSWFAAAASVALLVSVAYNFQLYKTVEDLQSQNIILTEDLDNLGVKFDKQLTETNRVQNDLNMLKRPGTRMIELKGMEKSPSSLAMIYWNQNTSEVFLHIESLPQQEDSMQYQLWAIVGGVPVDAGMIDLNAAKSEMLKMKPVQNPEAFAITLEQKGGNAAPNMLEMYVMGKNS